MHSSYIDSSSHIPPKETDILFKPSTGYEGITVQLVGEYTLCFLFPGVQ